MSLALARRRHPDLCFCPDCMARRPARRATKKKELARVRALVEGEDGKRADCTKCGAKSTALWNGLCRKCNP